MKFISARSSFAPMSQYTAKRAPVILAARSRSSTPELCAQVPMWLGGEINLRRSAPAADFNIVGFAFADGHCVVRQVGHPEKNLSQPRIGFFRKLLGFGDFFAQLLGLVRSAA